MNTNVKCLMSVSKPRLWYKRTHHARSIAVMTVRDFSSWFMTFSITARTAVIYVDSDLLINAFSSLHERQLHNKLEKEDSEFEGGMHMMVIV